jgi:hypothetical protein
MVGNARGAVNAASGAAAPGAAPGPAYPARYRRNRLSKAA